LSAIGLARAHLFLNNNIVFEVEYIYCSKTNQWTKR